jgi:hypothetical protein
MADSIKMVKLLCSLSNSHNQLFDPQERVLSLLFRVSTPSWMPKKSLKTDGLLLLIELISRSSWLSRNCPPKLRMKLQWLVVLVSLHWLLISQHRHQSCFYCFHLVILHTASGTTGTQANITQELAPFSAEAQATTSGGNTAPKRPSLFSSQDQSSRPPKRPRPNQDAPAGLDPDALEMEEFLKLCHFPLHDQYTQALITIHFLHHWSVKELKTVGFSLGPALLLHAGVACVNCQVALDTAGSSSSSRTLFSSLNLFPPDQNLIP